MFLLLSLSIFFCMTGISFGAETGTCYNCPPEWADWAAELKAIKETLGIDVPHDNKNSGQTLSQLIAEKNNPVADVAYFGVTFGILAKEAALSLHSNLPSGMKFLRD
jgi:putative spermidine/putrescine transport system substrate-binding protein